MPSLALLSLYFCAGFMLWAQSQNVCALQVNPSKKFSFAILSEYLLPLLWGKKFTSVRTECSASLWRRPVIYF